MEGADRAEKHGGSDTYKSEADAARREGLEAARGKPEAICYLLFVGYMLSRLD